MEKQHYYMVTWNNTKSTNRSYTRHFNTEAEAVKKARQVAKNPYADSIRVAEMEHWETPEPAPNGTSHGVFLGFIPWWMEN